MDEILKTSPGKGIKASLVEGVIAIDVRIVNRCEAMDAEAIRAFPERKKDVFKPLGVATDPSDV